MFSQGILVVYRETKQRRQQRNCAQFIDITLHENINIFLCILLNYTHCVKGIGLFVFLITVYNLYQSYVEALFRFIYCIGTVVLINFESCMADMDQNAIL
jgi:hypothetical protein